MPHSRLFLSAVALYPRWTKGFSSVRWPGATAQLHRVTSITQVAFVRATEAWHRYTSPIIPTQPDHNSLDYIGSAHSQAAVNLCKAMFFLSSPPQPPHPQFFSSPFAFTHSLTTPSPLRTSYNANGIKRARMSEHDNQPHTQSSPLSKPSLHIQDENAFSPTTATTSSCGGPSIFQSTTSSTTTSQPQPSFSFAARARAASPANQLSARAAHTKAANKARFLDRLRTRRDEGLGRDDRVLRADYLGERRAWEEEMARRAGAEIGVGVGEDWEGFEDGDEGEGMVMKMGDREQSPTEEKEIEELVALLEREEAEERRRVSAGGGGGGQGEEEGMEMGEDGDSQEWDEVFMEVLSQQEPMILSQDVGRGDGGADVDMS